MVVCRFTITAFANVRIDEFRPFNNSIRAMSMDPS